VHEIVKDKGVRVVNFATSKNLTVKSTMHSHRNIHKHLDVSINSQSDCSYSIDNVRSFRTAECDTHHYLVVAKLGSISRGSTKGAQKDQGSKETN
jgi:hypothetical protein